MFLDYPTSEEGGWIRTAFDRLDSLRVSRGEYSPYVSALGAQTWEPLVVVRPSPWLAERHAYEKEHYSNAYNFGGDVDEMLTEFEHYVFHFHDQFVEVIAGGLHFDVRTTPPDDMTLLTRPGWTRLPETAHQEMWELSGIKLAIRKSGADLDAIVEASELCDQVIVEVSPQLDGRSSVSHSLCARTRDGKTVSRWRGYFGNAQRAYSGVPELDELRPLIEAYASEVRSRRDAMGKP